MTRRERTLRLVLISTILFFTIGTVSASDPPDAKINPQSGYITTVDSYWDGSHFCVRQTLNLGDGESPQVTALSPCTVAELGPRLAMSPSGDTWVVWWRSDTMDEVLVRKQTFSDGTWSSERQVSSSEESSEAPEIVHDGTRPWVVYQAQVLAGTKIVVGAITEDPDPLTPIGIRTTTYEGDVGVRINAALGHLWVTWVDSEIEVGWSEYDYETGTWSSPATESYASDTVGAARKRIETAILGY
jgi:hypothetical protein